MSNFKSRGLSVLNGIYRFLPFARTAPEDYDLTSPIVSVHDVSREAELGAYAFDEKVGGFFQVGQDNAHPAASTVNSNPTVYTVTDQAFGSGSLNRVWCWLMWAGLEMNASGFLTSAKLSVQVPQVGSALAPRNFLIEYWDADIAQPTGGFGTPYTYFGVRAAAANQQRTRLPFLIPAGGQFGFQSITSGGDFTIRLDTICWVGPIGVMPPGMR